MSGTKEGAVKIAAAIKARFGDGFYTHIGKLGGSKPNTKPKGFAANPELARRAGKVGGSKSRRGPAKPHEERKAISMEEYSKMVEKEMEELNRKARESMEVDG